MGLQKIQFSSVSMQRRSGLYNGWKEMAAKAGAERPDLRVAQAVDQITTGGANGHPPQRLCVLGTLESIYRSRKKRSSTYVTAPSPTIVAPLVTPVPAPAAATPPVTPASAPTVANPPVTTALAHVVVSFPVTSVASAVTPPIASRTPLEPGPGSSLGSQSTAIKYAESLRFEANIPLETCSRQPARGESSLFGSVRSSAAPKDPKAQTSASSGGSRSTTAQTENELWTQVAGEMKVRVYNLEAKGITFESKDALARQVASMNEEIRQLCEQIIKGQPRVEDSIARIAETLADVRG
ncbi:mucin-7-like [Phalaenopsis equestris]|uniref:mucin-7-like n=1 Tax=Phalaenopsis equestris TaxID=78828 RepID=UPI0009E3D575|nr:mucin-7-like [Phalaenopsis equestris]